jgi:hypothetical protein
MQLGLPMKHDRLATMTHNYVRHHGTTTLFAALNVLDGWWVAACSVTAIRSLSASSTPSRRRYPRAS